MSKWILPQRLQKEPILQHLGFSPVRLPSSVRAKVRIVEKVPKMCFGSYILTSLSLSPTMPLLTYSNSALLVSLAFVEHTACFCLRDVALPIFLPGIIPWQYLHCYISYLFQAFCQILSCQ